MTEKEHAILGIDLGTTYCCVGMWNTQTRTVEIIPNAEGKRTTPSLLGVYANNEYVYGEEARDWLSTAPECVFWEVKRWIGRTLQEPELQEFQSRMSYQITSDESTPIWCIARSRDNTEEVKKRPEEVSAELLKHLKTQVEERFDVVVRDVVITVPAYFGEPQRYATKRAGELAGLNVLRVLPEPTAAALAYHWQEGGERCVMVYDWGGGTLDVSLVSMDNGLLEVIGMSGDHHLGGQDFDDALLRYVWGRYCAKCGKQVDASRPNEPFRSLLRSHMETVKRRLSMQKRVRIGVKVPKEVREEFGLIDKMNCEDGDLDWLTRDEMESACRDLFVRGMMPVEDLIRSVSSRWSENELNEVILVGGTTRMLLVREQLERRFPGIKIHQRLDPDEVVAYGATVQAALCMQTNDVRLSEITLLDVLPFSLGVEVMGGIFAKVLERNQVLPIEHKETFTTCEDDQTEVTIKVYQGERAFVKDNLSLGEFILENIPPGPRGSLKIEVTFMVDTNGILHVRAKDVDSGVERHVRFQVYGQETQVRDICSSEDLAKEEERKERILHLQQIQQWMDMVAKIWLKLREQVEPSIQEEVEYEFGCIREQVESWCEEPPIKEEQDMYWDKWRIWVGSIANKYQC